MTLCFLVIGLHRVIRSEVGPKLILFIKWGVIFPMVSVYMLNKPLQYQFKQKKIVRDKSAFDNINLPIA